MLFQAHSFLFCVWNCVWDSRFRTRRETSGMTMKMAWKETSLNCSVFELEWHTKAREVAVALKQPLQEFSTEKYKKSSTSKTPLLCSPVSFKWYLGPKPFSGNLLSLTGSLLLEILESKQEALKNAWPSLSLFRRQSITDCFPFTRRVSCRETQSLQDRNE